jgi:hypothetical protein
MNRLLIAFVVCMGALSIQGCPEIQTQNTQTLAEVSSRKDQILERLLPEDGLHPSRRAWLIDATVTVLPSRDREELLNVGHLREVLRSTSLPNLEKIERLYNEKAANSS